MVVNNFAEADERFVAMRVRAWMSSACRRSSRRRRCSKAWRTAEPRAGDPVFEQIIRRPVFHGRHGNFLHRSGDQNEGMSGCFARKELHGAQAVKLR